MCRRPCPKTALWKMGIERARPQVPERFRSTVDCIFLAAWTGVLFVGDQAGRAAMEAVLESWGATRLLARVRASASSSRLVPRHMEDVVLRSLLHYHEHLRRILNTGELRVIAGWKSEILHAASLVTAARNCFAHETELRTMRPPMSSVHLGFPRPKEVEQTDEDVAVGALLALQKL